MKKTLTNNWFIAFSLLWLSIFLCTKLQIYLWWPVQFYLIDLLAVPILGNLSLAFYRFILQNKKAILPMWSIAFLFFALSILFEWYLPQHKTRYVADVWDILMYATGALFFHFLMNKPLNDNPIA